MKTLDELRKNGSVYLGEFDSFYSVVSSFFKVYLSEKEYALPRDNDSGFISDQKTTMDIALKELKDINILFAYYIYESYEGDAIVLFEENGKLYEVHGGHCSCYGLEGQWEPEETSLKAIEFRFKDKRSYYSDTDKELAKYLGIEISE